MTASPALLPSPTLPYPAKSLARWLFVVAGMIWVMVIIGGLTRLTDSGLSITEWKPIHGIIPPLNAHEWQEEFARYQQYPEYQKMNRGMSLEAFQRIFWWEYIHRLWGRLIGVAFAVPLLYFTLRYRLPWRLKGRLVGLFVLGGLQGVLGWYMVQSGLVDRPDVSHFRLTAHLGLALLIFAACTWQGLCLWYANRPPLLHSSSPPAVPVERPLFWLLTVGVMLAITFGGFVAGMDAGLVYNTFPTMGGHWLPPEWGHLAPWWRDVTHNPVSMQFCHRGLGAGLWLLAFLYAVLTTRTTFRLYARLLAGAMTLQAGLGIATLLHGVPLALAALHQANAVLVVGLWTCVSFHRRILPPVVIKAAGC